jgi:hypothetical protein
MSKFAKGKSWIEHRLAGDVEVGGSHYTANLVARKGTGFQGFRVTVVFIPHEGGPAVEVEQPGAASTADVHRASRELAEDPARLASLGREAVAR